MSHDAVKTCMSLAQLWSWPSARRHYLSPAKWLKGPQLPPPALLPVDPMDACRCTWYASQTSSSLSRGKGSGARIWIENTTLFVRIGMSPGLRAYRAAGWLYQLGASGFTTDRALSGHLLQATGTDGPRTPGGNARAWLRPGWRALGAQWWPGAAETWTAFTNVVLIYNKPSLVSRSAAQQLAVTNDCC